MKDIGTASKEIEKAVTQLGGKVTGSESIGDKNVLTAELDSKKLKELIEKMKLIGVVEEKERALEGHGGDIEIRIEIMKIGVENRWSSSIILLIDHNVL